MKLYITSFILLIFTGVTYSQVVESSCTGSETITEDYRVDAGVLTLRKFYSNDLPYKDSIEIPEADVDTILNVMLAVWNATSLPARDTVVDMLSIAAGFDYDVRGFRIKCDTSLYWANQLIAGYVTSGNDTIDSLMFRYQLHRSTYLTIGSNNYIYFVSENNYNMPQLAKLFEPVYGIIDVFAICGYNPHIDENIVTEINPEYVDLHYSYGWDDCLNMCWYWRYWDFRVYYDCSVEYPGSHGDLLSGSNVLGTEILQSIRVFPNPFTRHINIEGVNFPLNYSLYNVGGILIMSGITYSPQVDMPGSLLPGIYVLKLNSGDNVSVKKIIKSH